MSERHIAVIGGGAIGLCTALNLRQKGFDVTVFDQGAVAGASSGGNAGMIVPSHIVPLAAPGVIAQGLRWLFKADSPFYIKPRIDPSLIRWLWAFRKACRPQQAAHGQQLLRGLMQQGMSLFDELATLPEMDCGLEKRGLLILHRTAKGETANSALVKQLQKSGSKAEMLSASAVKAMEPALPYEPLGAAFFPEDMHLDPARFLAGLAAHLRANDVTIHNEMEVTGLVSAGGKVVGINTADHTYPTDGAVICAGAWSPRLLRSLKLAIPVQAGKGYSITVEDPTRQPRVPMILGEEKVTITPMKSGLRFAGTLALAGLDPKVNQRRAAPILQTAAGYDSTLDPANFPTEKIWVGYRPCTPNGLPIIARAPGYDNVVIASGHAMVGITLAPITGKIAADLFIN